MSPESLYKLYFPLKLHFTGSYDIFKYNGATKMPEMPARLRGYLNILAPHIKSVPYGVSYFAACFSQQVDPFDYENGQKAQVAYERVGQSMTYFFEEDMMNLNSLEMDEVCMAAISGRIRVETLAILCTHLPDTFEWTHPLYDTKVFIAKKLDGFLRYDVDRVLEIIRSRM